MLFPAQGIMFSCLACELSDKHRIAQITLHKQKAPKQFMKTFDILREVLI